MPTVLREIRPRGVLLVTVLAAGALVAGCGTSNDDRTVGSVTNRFYDAVRAHAGTRACNQLSKNVVDALESASGRSCEQAITNLDLPGTGSAATTVYLDSARADVRGASPGEAVFLNRTTRGWRISAAGCKPKGDAPYDCELEG
jgi:hypothetical protein